MLQNKHVVVYPLGGVHTFVINVVVRAGSWYETGKNWGAFHLLEHAIADFGTRDLPSFKEFYQFTEDFGLQTRFYTSNSEIHVYIKGPDVSLNQGLYLLDQILFHPIINSPDLSREISVIEQEYKDKWSNPDIIHDNLVNQQMYGENHPYVRDGLGQPEYIKTLSGQFLQDLHQQYFVKPNLYISVSGHVAPRKTFKFINQILNRHPGNKAKATIPQPIFNSQTIFSVRDSSQTASVSWVWPISGVKNRSILTKMKLNILTSILGGSANSRLFTSIRNNHGLAYYISSHCGYYSKAGFFSIAFSIDPTNYQTVSQLIDQEVSIFLSQPIPSEELDRIINSKNLNVYSGYDSPDSISGMLADQLFLYGRIIKPEEYINLSKKIKESSLRQMFRKIISQPKLVAYTAAVKISL